jgi:plasmid maintenance system killer protein
MNVYISDKDLKNLYLTGTSKKLKLRKDIIDKFFASVQKISAARDIYDLWQDPALKFEKYKDHYSVRLSGKFRLEMNVEWEDNDKIRGDFYLFRISSHYGD